MKIVGILGSLRKGGNTEILLDLALEEAKKNACSIQKITLRNKKISPCNGCQKCMKNGKCVIKDDMQDIYKNLLEAQGIIWATPVYFWSMTGLTKIALDRTYALTFPKLQLANKIGGLILVAGNRGCLNTANIFHMYFNYNHMFFTEYSFGYAQAKGAIKENTLAINMVKEMVHQMISLINSNLKYPDEFDAPLIRFVRRKYQL